MKRLTKRARTWGWISFSAIFLGAAPAVTTSIGPERAISDIRASWVASPEPSGGPSQAAGWNALGDAILADLKLYREAANESDRLAALGRLHQVWSSLQSVNWPLAQRLRDELALWLRPRVIFAWAQQRLNDSIAGLPPAADPNVMGNRARWLAFAQDEIGRAWAAYESASSVASRHAAIEHLNQSLERLRLSNQATPWSPSLEIETAMAGLIRQPNAYLVADINSVRPRLENNLVTNGPVYRKGQISYVTAGPKTGFGLLPCDNGISFFNRQRLSSVTPVRNFQQQIEQDPRGQMIARLYHFNMTTYDRSELTVLSTISTDGLALSSDATHASDAKVVSAPIPGHSAVARLALATVGFDKDRLTQEVEKNAVKNVRQQVPIEAREERNERMSKAQAEQNVKLRQYLIGNRTVLVGPVAVKELELKSRVDHVRGVGRVTWNNAPGQTGADMPRPTEWLKSDPGIHADIHLISLLNNLARGAFQGPDVQAVQTLAIETDVPPLIPAGAGAAATTEPEVKPAVERSFKTERNLDFAAYAKAVAELKTSSKGNKTLLRITRPASPPEFAADAEGRLVAFVRDFKLEFPNPSTNLPLLGQSAKIYRIESPLVEVVLSFSIEPGESRSIRVKGKIESIDLGRDVKLLGLGDDESKANTLSRLAAAPVLGSFTARVQGQAIDVPLNNLDLPGFLLRGVSPLHPSGWVRLTLDADPASTPPASTPGM